MKHLLELLEATAARFGPRTALADEARALTWAETLGAVQGIGTALGRLEVQSVLKVHLRLLPSRS